MIFPLDRDGRQTAHHEDAVKQAELWPIARSRVMRGEAGDVLPTISLIVPTCNRPSDVKRMLQSLAAVHYPCWDLLIVDQSDDGLTREIVEKYVNRLPGLHYLAVQLKGVSRARNVGIDHTTGEIIALLDDDCTVAPDWLQRVADVFTRYPRADLVLGELRPVDGRSEWSVEGWTPTRLHSTEQEVHVLSSRGQHLHLWPKFMGNGACMFMRRTLAQRIGPFDVNFGPVGRFKTAEDGDYIYRTHMAGCRVVCTPTIVADHHGLRDYQSGAASRLIHAYQYGIAAFLMKVLRGGDLYALLWIIREIYSAMRRINLRNIALRRGSTGLLPLRSFVQGLRDSFLLKIDQERHLYVARTKRLR